MRHALFSTSKNKWRIPYMKHPNDANIIRINAFLNIMISFVCFHLYRIFSFFVVFYNLLSMFVRHHRSGCFPIDTRLRFFMNIFIYLFRFQPSQNWKFLAQIKTALVNMYAKRVPYVFVYVSTRDAKFTQFCPLWS